ncbi:hypothetical protein EV424DRAFT_1341760, partial [Suillus variegatus]
CLANLDPITVSLVDNTFGVFNHWDEVVENIKGFSDVVYAVTLLTVGEFLLSSMVNGSDKYQWLILWSFIGGGINSKVILNKLLMTLDGLRHTMMLLEDDCKGTHNEYDAESEQSTPS